MIPTIKVGGPGEGKTKWLMQKLFFNVQVGKKVYLLMNDSDQFSRFMNKYQTRYNSICPVERATKETVFKSTDVLLIDDLMKEMHATCKTILLNAFNSEARIYITINGIQETDDIPDTEIPECVGEQLHIDVDALLLSRGDDEVGL